MVLCLRRLNEYRKDQNAPQKLRKRIGKIIELLENHFGYYIEEEAEDEMPVVVPEN